jgi:tetratricopeptide (TPR) repeat protein
MNGNDVIPTRFPLKERPQHPLPRLRSGMLAAVLGIAVVFSGCAARMANAPATAADAEAGKRAVDLFIEGKTAEAKEDREAAITYYLEALQYNPHSEDIALALAKACYLDGKMMTSLSFALLAEEINPSNPDVWMILQVIYQQNHDLKNATTALENYMKLTGDKAVEDYIRLARYYFNGGKGKKARELLLDRAGQKDISRDDIAVIADFFSANEMYSDSITLYGRLVERDPTDVDSWVEYGLLYSDTNRDSLAVEVLKKGIERNPDNQTLYLSLGNICMLRNDWECAISSFQKARAMGFSASKILMTLSSLNFYAGHDKEAEALRDSVIAMGEDIAPFYFSLGKCMNSLERYQAAADYYQKGFGKALDQISDDDKMNAYIGYLQVLIKLEKGDEALRVARDEAPKNLKNFNSAKDLEGVVYMELKQYGDAAAVYEWLADTEPANARYVISLSQSYSEGGKFKEAAQVLLDALEKSPDNTRYLMQLGIVYDMASEFDKAEEALLKVIGKEPGNALALNNLAYMYMERGKNLSKAIDMVKRAIAIEPENGAYLDTLAWGYYLKGKTAEARKTVERSLTFADSQDKGVIYSHYGDILMRLGLKTQAAAAWGHAIEFGENKDEIQKKIDGTR